MEEGKKLPSEYPCEIYDLIIKDGGAERTFENVYRIAEKGKLNRDAFLSSFQEKRIKNSCENSYNNRDAFLAEKEVVDIGDYSTSCFQKRRNAKKILKLKARHVDGPKILIGTILPETGLSMLTAESRSNRMAMDSHIDWWIYQGVDPSPYFRFELKEED